MKKKILLIIIIILIFNVSYAEISPSDININLDGEIMILEEPPYIVNSRALLPLRYIFEPLGLEVSWIEETRTVIGKKEDLIIELVIGSDKALVNDEVIDLDVPAIIINDRTYIPVRFIAESTGAIVLWNNDTRTVSISKKYNYDNLSITDLLISIYGDKNKDKSDIIREKYHVILDKIETISQRNKFDENNFKNAIIELASSFGSELSNEEDLKNLFELFNQKKIINTNDLISYLKSNYVAYEFYNGDIYYGNDDLIGLSLYEFSNITKLVGILENSKRNGYVTNVYENGYDYCNYTNDKKIGYEFSYLTDSGSNMMKLTYYVDGKKEGNSYEIRYDVNFEMLYYRYTIYSNDNPIDLSEIYFSDGAIRYDKTNSKLNDIVLNIDRDGVYFILPTDETGISLDSNTGFAYKKFENDVEYIGNFIEETRTGDGYYYASDDKSLLETNLLEQFTDEIIEKNIIENQSDVEKIRNIYDYLATHIIYDTEIDENNNYSNMSHTAYGALIDGVAVCDGYSEAFKYILDKLDIETIIIFGEASVNDDFTGIENHAWNLVKINDEYRHFDLTWDDDDLNKIINYDYYNKDSDFIDDTHQWDIIKYEMYFKE